MRIEGSGISCGVRRLIVEPNDKPTKEELAGLIKINGSCAMIVTGIPTRRRNITTLLLDNGFEQVKNPAQAERKVKNDDSVNSGFIDMASLMMYHDHEIDIDDSVLFEQFVGSTVSNEMIDMANLVLHHGSEIAGNLSFFVCYTNKN